MEPSKFRRLTIEEKIELATAFMTPEPQFCSLAWVVRGRRFSLSNSGKRLNMPILAVGAAFPFLAGVISQAPAWMQNYGLEWLFRLVSEPRRLWRRYVYLNPAYLFLLTLQALRLSRFAPDGKSPAEELLYG